MIINGKDIFCNTIGLVEFQQKLGIDFADTGYFMVHIYREVQRIKRVDDKFTGQNVDLEVSVNKPLPEIHADNRATINGKSYPDHCACASRNRRIYYRFVYKESSNEDRAD